MSTTTQLKVMKNMPYQVRARANGKWDLTSNQTFTTDGEAISLSMTAYTGLDMDYEVSYQSADTLDFSNTVLPWKWQYSTALTTDRYCLMPTGQNYEGVVRVQWMPSNFNVAGGVTINENKVASNFSSSNYLKLQNVFNPTSNPWEMVFKVKTGSDVTTTHVINGSGVLSGADCQGACIITLGGNFVYYLSSNGSSWNIFSEKHGATAISTNTEYLVKLEFTGTAYNLYVNGVLDATVASSTPIYVSSEPMVIGGSFYTSSNDRYWNGDIDLSESYIKINGADWWVPEFTKASSGVTETLPGCTYNFTDDGSATTLNCFALNGDESVVLTPDNSYNIPAQQGGYWQGSVNNFTNSSIEVFNNDDIVWSWDGSYNIVGNPIIEEDDDVVNVSGFSQGNYVETQNPVNFTAGDFWEAGCEIVYNGTGKQVFASSDSFEVGIDASGHPYGTFYGVGTITASDIIITNGDIINAAWGFWDDFDEQGTYYYLGGAVNGGEESFETPYLYSSTKTKPDKIRFGLMKTEAQEGWLLGTVSIPSHTVYTYEDGTWTEANNA